MKIGIIGGNGYLGKKLANYLLKKKIYFEIFDVKKNKEFPNTRIGNILSRKDLDKFTKNKSLIYNFAGQSDLNDSFNKPLETAQQNILGTINILNSCKKNKIKKYIHASTIYVGGDKGSFYRCSKKAAEEFIIEFNKRYKLNFSIIRFGSLYGPGSDMRNGLHKIIYSAIKKKVIEYEGSKESIREYIHVEDAAKICFISSDKQYNNKIIIASGLDRIKIVDLAHMLSEILNIKKIIFKNKKTIGHYKYSPYSLDEMSLKKIILPSYIDIAQGLMQVAKEIKKKKK